MAEKGYKYKVIRELNFIANDDSFSDMERNYASQLGDKLVDKNDEEIKKILYASFNDPKLYNITKAIASAMPKDTEIEKVTRASAKAPKYRTEIGEMFENFGGDEVIDERSPKYWATNPEMGDKVISEIAEANGMPKQELYKMLQDESNKERNRQIFSGTDIGSTTGDRLTALGLKFFAPRTMESLEQGKGLVPADVATDVAENIVYGINPIGKAGQLGIRAFGKLAPRLATPTAKAFGSAGTHILSSFGTPALMEATDKIVQESIDSDREKTAMEAVGSVFGEGLANLMADRRAMRLFGTAIGKGERKGIRKAISDEFGEAEKVAEDVAKKPQNTAKEFISETEKALKQREKVQKKIEEKGRGVKPSEQEILESSAPIVTASGGDMNKNATEIAKLMAKQDLSLEEATAKHFEKIRKKMKDDDAFQKYVNEFKFEIPSKTNAEKNVKEIGYDVYIGDDGLVKPTKNLEEAIKKSSWGSVFTTKFEKPKRETPKKESFIRKQLKFGTIEPKSYAKFKSSDVLGEKTTIPLVNVTIGEKEKEAREKEKKRSEEEKARSRYVFNPYKTEEEVPKKPSGIRAYLRGEAEKPTPQEIEEAIYRRFGM